MNSYIFYRRIRGPVYLLTFGVTALLAQWNVLGFERSWPLYLIVAGVMRLAERAAMSVTPPMLAGAPLPPSPDPLATHSGAGQYSSVQPAPYAPGTGLATVAPAPMQPSGFTPGPEEDR